MSKYSFLKNHLRNLPDDLKQKTYSFSQIEEIIEAKLPQSAHKHNAWWANEKDGRHVQAHAWKDAGWEVMSVNQKEKWGQFIRE